MLRPRLLEESLYASSGFPCSTLSSSTQAMGGCDLATDGC